MKYTEYKGLEYAKIADDILKFWKENQVFEKSVTEREGAPTFTFYEGPPSANGTPGIHHVMARAVKDVFCRYKTMQGFQVKRKGGWDTHGLPVELQVEKELGITKEDIGKKISVEEYNKKCRETVMRYTDQWDEMTEKMGYWVDLKNPYITYEKNYIESLWYLLKELYKKGLLYKGYTIQPYSPAAGTGLSSHELNQPGTYKDVKDTTIVAQFKIKGKEDEFILAWTTTPWTLPANSALAVGDSINYVKVETYNPYTFKKIKVILAKDLTGKYFSEKAKELTFEEYKEGDKTIPYRIVEEYKGKDLVGIEYEQLLPYVTPDTPAFRVISGDFVSTEDGTGIVHISPTFGADDFRVANKAGIPSIMVMDENGKPAPIVDKQGRFVKEITDFAGEYVKEQYLSDAQKEAERVKQGRDKYLTVDERISIKLKEANRAFKVEKYEHTYPHCWRTDKPVLYYPLDSWFIKTTAYKDKLVALNKTINWKPESTGQGRFGNWLENLVDWNLSRSRYWGTPLPVWRTEDGTEEICIGSVAELESEMQKATAAGIKNPESVKDLHRPYVDEITLVSASGKPMKRELDLIDVWFDSGAMPYAQWHYPFDPHLTSPEGGRTFSFGEGKGEVFPADFIAEGVDQTRGWFFTLHALAVMLFDNVAFKNVIANGLVLDKNGNKMSKRLGNAVDPFETLKKYGPDATRWYMIVNAPPWDNLKFNLDGVTEVQRRFFATLYNTYNFFALYANLDKFTYSEEKIALEKRTESDRWIISKLNSLVADVQSSMEDYEPTKATRAIQDFVSDDLSNWYVRLNRKRFWMGEYNENKRAAYQTLYECLLTVSKLSAPFAPFYAEHLFNDLNGVTKKEKSISVHLSSFPVSDKNCIDAELEKRMDMAQKISSLVHSLRKKHTIKVRQPLAKILVPVLNAAEKQRITLVEDLIKTEVNIKTVEYIDDTSGILKKKIKPNFKVLGKKFGPKLKAVSDAITAMNQDNIRAIEKDNAFKINIGEEIELTLEDVEILSEDIPGWLVATDNGLTVALDITITDELKKEGIARDLVNRIQNMRKDMGLEVQDKIKIQIEKKDELINTAFESNREYICTETQALELSVLEKVANAQEVDMDEFMLQMQIEKA